MTGKDRDAFDSFMDDIVLEAGENDDNETIEDAYRQVMATLQLRLWEAEGVS